MACAVVEKLQSVCLRLKGAVSSRHSRMAKRQTRSVQISDPYNFKKLSGVPEGFDVDEMNVLKEKAAASCLIAIEDQPPTRPSSAAGGTQVCYFHTSQTHQHHQVKSRAGYRGLASSSAANAAAANHNRGLHYSASTTESRPSITRSFAAVDDNATPRTPTSSGSVSPTSTLLPSSVDGRRERRRFASSI